MIVVSIGLEEADTLTRSDSTNGADELEALVSKFTVNVGRRAVDVRSNFLEVGVTKR
jgi:hypothetical protein